MHFFSSQMGNKEFHLKVKFNTLRAKFKHYILWTTNYRTNMKQKINLDMKYSSVKLSMDWK